MKKQMIIMLLALLATGCTSINAKRAVSNSALDKAIASGAGVIYIRQEHIIPIDAVKKPQEPLLRTAGIDWAQLAAPIIGELAGKLTDLESEKLKTRSNMITTGTEVLITHVNFTNAYEFAALLDKCVNLADKSSMQRAIEGVQPATDVESTETPDYPIENVSTQVLRASMMTPTNAAKRAKAP